jgi:hypothetical protein
MDNFLFINNNEIGDLFFHSVSSQTTNPYSNYKSSDQSIPSSDKIYEMKRLFKFSPDEIQLFDISYKNPIIRTI